ncbi:MAG: gliding motility-associated C-terminal domain-containing protein [Bacteroidetes bacterium]|nr:gliding motility-associated C-terminal domain-containing protein [Bacteroidota bacterium]
MSLISCGSNTVTFQNFSFNAGSYHWDFGVTGQTNDTSNIFSPVFTYPDTGVYNVTLIAYSNVDPGCTDTTTGTVTVLPPYVADYSFSLDTCSNLVSFNDTSNSISGVTTIRNWRFGDNTTSSLEDPVHQYAAAGNYLAILIATSARGCKDTVIKQLNIPPLLDIQTQQNLAARCHTECNGLAQVQALHGLSPYTFQWNDPLNQTTSTADSLCAGQYIVRVTDARGCTSIDTIQITEPLPLSLSMNSTPDYCNQICGGTATALPAGGNGNYSYQWNDPQNQTSASATGLCQGTYAVLISDGLGCTYTDSITVNYVDSFPIIAATADTNLLYSGQSTGLHANPSSPGFTYSWTPSSSLNNSSSSDPIATPPENTTYIVIATDPNGCSVTDTLFIEVKNILCDEPEIYIPSAFSPNGDQKNDEFMVRGNTIETLYLAIYDRWGEKVFETRDQRNGWNGFYKGKLVPPDVYVYYVESTCFNKAEFRKKGNITVIR